MWLGLFGFDLSGGRSLICVMFVVAIVVLATSFRQPARRCRRCQEINRPHAIFCAQCGGRLGTT